MNLKELIEESFDLELPGLTNKMTEKEVIILHHGNTKKILNAWYDNENEQFVIETEDR